MKRIWKGIRGCWYYFWGHLFALMFYDRKYLRGRWFAGKLNGLCSIGWEWVTYDALARIRSCENATARFPVAHGCRVIYPENIEFDPDDLNNFQGFGDYYQAIGRIKIGKGTYIAPNVGLITANHDLLDPDRHLEPKPIELGNKCWIGMNSVLLPGVTLGDHTIVGAGSVVTKSFKDGWCVIAGNPAKIIKELFPPVIKTSANGE